jgi:hypothetical protein
MSEPVYRNVSTFVHASRTPRLHTSRTVPSSGFPNVGTPPNEPCAATSRMTAIPSRRSRPFPAAL